jgi:ferredoxin
MTSIASHIELHHDLCMGAGNCVDVAPKYFDQSDDDGRVVVLQDVVDQGDEDLVSSATNVCPVRALGLRRADGSR